MSRTSNILVGVLGLCLTAVPAAAQQVAPFIQHVPLNQVELGPTELLFQIHDPDRAGKVVVWLVRDDVEGPPTAFAAYRTERGYVVVIPTASIGEPGFSYWVVERAANGEERPLFAAA